MEELEALGQEIKKVRRRLRGKHSQIKKTPPNNTKYVRRHQLE